MASNHRAEHTPTRPGLGCETGKKARERANERPCAHRVWECWYSLRAMIVMKFGGSSVANRAQIDKVRHIVAGVKGRDPWSSARPTKGSPTR